MPTKVRKQIYIEPEQEAMLKHLSEELGLPEAEIIRQAIDAQTHQIRILHRDPQVWAAERDFIERLIKQGPITGGRNWRREDLYDR